LDKEYQRTSRILKTYLSKFDKKSNRYVVISTETTGLNPHKDVILSIGAFAVVDDSLFISDSFEAILLQYKYYMTTSFQMNLLLKAR
jgi:DNA polymerase-3 subunit epsilon